MGHFGRLRTDHRSSGDHAVERRDSDGERQDQLPGPAAFHVHPQRRVDRGDGAGAGASGVPLPHRDITEPAGRRRRADLRGDDAAVAVAGGDRLPEVSAGDARAPRHDAAGRLRNGCPNDLHGPGGRGRGTRPWPQRRRGGSPGALDRRRGGSRRQPPDGGGDRRRTARRPAPDRAITGPDVGRDRRLLLSASDDVDPGDGHTSHADVLRRSQPSGVGIARHPPRCARAGVHVPRPGCRIKRSQLP